MIKKTITYTDHTGRSLTEDFYFNLTQFEAVQLQVSRAGGFSETLEFLSKSGNQKEQLAVIKEVLLAAYGEVTGVSRHFVKTPEFAEAFSHTEAFSTLFFELFSDAARCAAFFDALMPVMSEQAYQAGQRPATQDHQTKAQPDFKTVEIPLADEPQQNQPSDGGVEHRPRMSPASFQALAPADAASFIRNGGEIDASL